MMMRSHSARCSLRRVGVLGMSCLSLLLGGFLLSPAAEITHSGGKILFAGNGFTLSFSDTNGSILSVTTNGQPTTIFAGGEFGLWSASFQGAGSINANAFSAGSLANNFSWTADAPAGNLNFNYTNAQIAVLINISERSDGIDFAAQAFPAQTNILEFALPARLRFVPGNLGRLICPLNSNE